jgi:hypothetical protein
MYPSCEFRESIERVIVSSADVSPLLFLRAV